MNKYKAYQELYTDNWNALAVCVINKKLTPTKAISLVLGEDAIERKDTGKEKRYVKRNNHNLQFIYIIEDLETKEIHKGTTGELMIKLGITNYGSFTQSYQKRIKLGRKYKVIDRIRIK